MLSENVKKVVLCITANANTNSKIVPVILVTRVAIQPWIFQK